MYSLQSVYIHFMNRKKILMEIVLKTKENEIIINNMLSINQYNDKISS